SRILHADPRGVVKSTALAGYWRRRGLCCRRACHDRFCELGADLGLSLFCSLPPPIRSFSIMALCYRGWSLRVFRCARSDRSTRPGERCSWPRFLFLPAALGARDIICSRQSNAGSMVAAVVRRMVSERRQPCLSCSQCCCVGRLHCLHDLTD